MSGLLGCDTPPWIWRQQVPPKHWYHATPHGVTTQWRRRQQVSPKHWYLPQQCMESQPGRPRHV